MPIDASVRRCWIEAAVVIVIILLAVALIAPAVQQAREASRRVQSRNNLKQIGLALHNYLEAYQIFPPGAVIDANGTEYIGWQFPILPYIDSGRFYNSIDQNVPWNVNGNADRFKMVLPVYINPECTPTRDATGYALSHYAGNKYLLFPNSSMKLADITDGTEQTILAGEVFANYLPYAQPGNWRHPRVGIHRSADSFGRPNADGALLLMADGAVHWTAKGIDVGVFHAMGTPAGRENIPPAVFSNEANP